MVRNRASRLLLRCSRLRGYVGREFRWALSGNVIYSLCQWTFFVVLAKLGSPGDVGAYALGLAITSPILMFANFQGRNLVASDVRDEYSFGEHLSFRIVSLAFALLVVCAVIALIQSSRPAGAVIFLVGLGQCFDYASETYFGLLQKHDRLDRVSLSLMLKGPLCLILLSVAMYLTRNVLWAVAALAVGRGLILWCFDTRNAIAVAGHYQLDWKRAIQVRLFFTALPLGVISALCGLNLNIPRYFIEGDLSKHDLGIFSALASLVGAGNLVMAALASCSIVGLARAWVSRDTSKYRSLSLQLFAVSALMGSAGVLVAFLAGHKVLALLFRPDYESRANVLARIMVAGALGYVVSAQGYAMTAARKLVQQIPLLIGTAGVTTMCSWYLVPRRGLEGAAEAWVLGSLFLLACNTALMAHMSRDTDPSSALAFQNAYTGAKE
jgi:O-antigen/teichoic acid export membrane protein